MRFPDDVKARPRELSVVTRIPEFAVEDLPLSRPAALVPEFAVKDLPLGIILMMILYCNNKTIFNII